MSFGVFSTSAHRAGNTSTPRYGSFLTAAAVQITSFEWAAYGFSNGHFASSISTGNLPFSVVLATDPFVQNRSLFSEFTECQQILPGVTELYAHIRSSGITTDPHGYLIHSHRLPPGDSTKNFWQIQASIVSELRKIRSLSVVVAFVHSEHDAGVTRRFTTSLCRGGWLLTDHQLYFPDYGDTVACTITIIIGVHKSTISGAKKIQLLTPPQVAPAPLAAYLWAPFDKLSSV